jgi:hypothetical protein
MKIAMAIHSPSPANGGMQRLTLTLTPTELGSVSFDIRETAEGGRRVALVFDRAETMALFEKDRQHLATALDRAGLQAHPDQITFALASPPPSGSQSAPASADHATSSGSGFDATDRGGGQSERGGARQSDQHGIEAGIDPRLVDIGVSVSSRLDLRAGLDIFA